MAGSAYCCKGAVGAVAVGVGVGGVGVGGVGVVGVGVGGVGVVGVGVRAVAAAAGGALALSALPSAFFALSAVGFSAALPGVGLFVGAFARVAHALAGPIRAGGRPACPSSAGGAGRRRAHEHTAAAHRPTGGDAAMAGGGGGATLAGGGGAVPWGRGYVASRGADREGARGGAGGPGLAPPPGCFRSTSLGVRNGSARRLRRPAPGRGLPASLVGPGRRPGGPTAPGADIWLRVTVAALSS